MSSDYHKGFVLRDLRKGEGYSDRWVEIAIGFVGRLGICHDAELVSLASLLGPKCRGAVTYKVTAKKERPSHDDLSSGCGLKFSDQAAAGAVFDPRLR
jgi:hypothetical protein